MKILLLAASIILLLAGCAGGGVGSNQADFIKALSSRSIWPYSSWSSISCVIW